MNSPEVQKYLLYHFRGINMGHYTLFYIGQNLEQINRYNHCKSEAYQRVWDYTWVWRGSRMGNGMHLGVGVEG